MISRSPLKRSGQQHEGKSEKSLPSVANQQQEPKLPRLGVYHLTSEEGSDIGVAATSEAEAIKGWLAVTGDPDWYADDPLTARRVPDDREVPIWWIDDKPTDEDVPQGGRIAPYPPHPEYLSVFATAGQWCSYYAKSGRDFFIMWEAE